MPNWCSTTYIFRGDKDELDILYDKIAKWTASSFVKTDFGRDWLGNILYGAGLGDRIDNPDANGYLRCRGTLVDIYPFDGYLQLTTETAWNPMSKMWDAVIEQLGLTTVGFTFMAEECGCGLYQIYDPHNYGDFEGMAYIDSFGDEVEDLNDYYSEKNAIKVLNEFFGTSFDDLSSFYSLCEKYNDEHDGDSFISVHKFELDNEVYE